MGREIAGEKGRESKWNVRGQSDSEVSASLQCEGNVKGNEYEVR